MQIKINVLNKIATAEDDYKIICGNSDYTIKFAFDSEWDNHAIKTARFGFTQNGIKKYIDILFEGTECNMPVLSNTKTVEIGVFAGELHTTTPCLLMCEKSILCDSGTPEEPPEDIYNQIIEKCDEAVTTAKEIENRANNGDFNGEKGDKGDKGDAGVLEFVVVAELPTENIKNAIYLLPNADETEKNLFDEYVFINGAWEKIGSAGIEVNLDEYVKNTDLATSTKAGLISGGGMYGARIMSGQDGHIAGISRNTEQYKGLHYCYLICKGTLEAIKSQYVKEGLTANTETLTDEEKAIVIEWLGIDKYIAQVLAEKGL